LVDKPNDCSGIKNVDMMISSSESALDSDSNEWISPRVKKLKAQQVPKILVVGSEGCGKTTFVQTLFASHEKAFCTSEEGCMMTITVDSTRRNISVIVVPDDLDTLKNYLK
jgi:septin family protein